MGGFQFPKGKGKQDKIIGIIAWLIIIALIFKKCL